MSNPYTMSAISQLTARLNALEAEVKTLRAMTPLESFTAGLANAEPDKIAEWMSLCHEMATAYAPPEAVAKAKEAKEAKPRAPSNATGPKEWNLFIRVTWNSMAAEKGILIDDFSGDDATKDKAFKKATANAGITYHSVMKEASRRKALAEGKDPNAPKEAKKAPKEAKEAPKGKTDLAQLKAKVVAAKAAKAASVGGGSAPAKKLETGVEEEEVEVEVEEEMVVSEEMKAAALDMNWEIIKHDGALCYKDLDNNEVYTYPDTTVLGKYLKDGSFQRYV